MLINLRNLIKLTVNRRNIAKISGGTLLGQGISFITVPFFARIYGVEVIGTWALFSAISSIIISTSDLGMTNAIMVENDDTKVRETYKVITTIVALISVFSGMLMTVYYKFIPPPLGMSIPFLFLFFVTLTFTTQQTQICYTWLNRKGKYNVLMKNPMITGIAFGVSGISLGLMGYTTYGYFIGCIVGQIATLTNMRRYLPKSMFTLRIQDYKAVFARNMQFIVFQLPTNIFADIKDQLPTFLIKGFWGTEMLGYYSITLRLLQMPISLLATAIGRVFFQTTSAMKREGKEIGEYVYKNLTVAMKIGVLPMTLFMAFGDIVVIMIFGNEWKVAGDFVRILALQYFFNFLVMSAQGLSITLDKQNYAMFTCIAQAIAYVIGTVLGKYIFDDIYIGLLLTSVSCIIIEVTFFCVMFKVMNISWRKYVRSVLFYIVLIIGFAAILRGTFNMLGMFN